MDGTTLARAGASGVVGADGVKVPGTSFFQWNIEDVHAAAYDVDARLELMDEQGIWAQIVYPNTVGFGGQKFVTIDDETLRRLSVELYNDAMAEMQERVGPAAVPDGHRAVVGRRPRGRRDRAHRRRSGCAASTPRPRRTTTACPTSATSTGTRCGRPRRRTTCRSTSTSAPATRRCRGSVGAVAVAQRRPEARARLGDDVPQQRRRDRQPHLLGRARALSRRCSSCRSRAASAGSRSSSRRSTTRSAR